MYVSFSQETATLFGIDWDAPLSTDSSDAEQVHIPDIPNPLSPADYARLQNAVRPMEWSSDFGSTQYRRTLNFVNLYV